MPLLATYRIVDGHCCGHCVRLAGATQAAYHNFIEGFAQGIGSYRAVLFLEMDSIITMPCLSHHGQAVREHELQRRDQRAHARTARTWSSTSTPAPPTRCPRATPHKFLRASGVAKIQGFFLNATHFDWTSNEIRYGEPDLAPVPAASTSS